MLAPTTQIELLLNFSPFFAVFGWKYLDGFSLFPLDVNVINACACMFGSVCFNAVSYFANINF